MRVTENESYQERRDALSQDWCDYLTRHFRNILPIPIMNNDGYIPALVSQLKLNGVILSGGNDYGEAPDRDRAERCLIGRCLEDNIPIFGVCRGLHILNQYFGGSLKSSLSEITTTRHAGTYHDVSIPTKWFCDENRGVNTVKVNSYHNQGVTTNTLASTLKAFAIAESGVVEGFVHPTRPLIAIQWHPERQNPCSQLDKRIVKSLFIEGVFWDSGFYDQGGI